MWSVNHSNRNIEFYERAEFNVYADLKHQMGGAGQMVFAEILLGQSFLAQRQRINCSKLMGNKWPGGDH